MRVKGRASVRSSPAFTLDAELEPIAFSTAATGSLSGHIGEMSAVVGEIPLKLSIPFLRRRGRLQLVGSIGGLTIKVRPLQLTIERASVDATGVLGVKGLRGRAFGKAGCETDVKGSGVVSGATGTVVVRDDHDDEGGGHDDEAGHDGSHDSGHHEDH